MLSLIIFAILVFFTPPITCVTPDEGDRSVLGAQFTIVCGPVSLP